MDNYSCKDLVCYDILIIRLTLWFFEKSRPKSAEVNKNGIMRRCRKQKFINLQSICFKMVVNKLLNKNILSKSDLGLIWEKFSIFSRNFAELSK